MVTGYILIILSANYGLKKAKKAHNVTLKDVKNEIKSGYFFRGICSLIYYFCIIYWIFNLSFIPYFFIPYNLALHISGLILFSLVVCLFWWIHISLGSNYHGPLKLHENHKLITSGPYAFARHPTYVAFPLLHISLFLITHSWLLLISGMVMAIYVNSKRIQIEEELLLKKFGKEYENYKKKVGKYFIILRNKKES